MEKAEALSTEIREMYAQIYELNKIIQRKKYELKCSCPHENVHEEYDDDFHKPRRYYLCITCGTELDIKYNI
jgi:predicted SprT family Zn-dependent metalloprotease